MTWLVEHFGIISDLIQFLSYFLLGAILWVFRNVNKVLQDHKQFEKNLTGVQSDIDNVKKDVEGRLDTVEEKVTLLESKVRFCQDNHGGRTNELIDLIKELTKKIDKVDRSVSFVYGKIGGSGVVPLDVYPHMSISDKETDNG